MERVWTVLSHLWWRSKVSHTRLWQSKVGNSFFFFCTTIHSLKPRKLMVTGPHNPISPRNIDQNESGEIKTRHVLNNASNFCSAPFSDQPTEAAPVWERLISSRCATGKSARTSTATRERTNAMPGTLTMSCIATSTTGCLMNTQTVSVHPQVEERGSAAV